jgi:phospholipid/cholesterol/gamma-HCH transport system substrate-binding protein
MRGRRVKPGPARVLVPVLLLGGLLSGCSFGGVQSLTLPGGTGTGGDATTIVVELPDIGTLTNNAEVKVGDVAVGTVTGLSVADWHAEAEISLEPDVELPANALAKVGVNSLLGSSYVELSAPPTGAQGRLESGDRIPLDRSRAYPATEQVLASASVVLNGGGLEQLSTITKELGNALSGNDLAIRDLLPRVDSFVGALNSQRSDIIAAIQDVDRLSQRFADRRGTITRALDELGPALTALSEERPQLTKALAELRALGDVATPVLSAARADLTANLSDLVPALRALSRAGDSLARGLGYAVTFPFPTDTVDEAVVSDYHNLFLTVDLTADAFVDGFLTPEGQLGLPGLPGLDKGLLQLLPGLGDLPLLGSLLETGGSGGTGGAGATGSPGTTGTRDSAAGATGGGSVIDDLLGGVLPLMRSSDGVDR